MRLYLLRHAEASYDASDDASRMLTFKGERSVGRLCRRLREKEFQGLQVIHHSGYTRAEQTAELFRDALALPVPVRARSRLTPMDDPRALADFLWEGEEDRMLVGHNPHLARLTAWLLTGDVEADCIHFKKCGLLCLERGSGPCEARPAGVWLLSWFAIDRPFGDA